MIVLLGGLHRLNQGGGGRTSGENHYKLGFDLSKYSYPNKEKLLNNCVYPEIGLAILDSAMNIIREKKVDQSKLF